MLKRFAVLSLVAAMCLPTFAQDESFGDQVRTLLNEGTDLYKRGKYPEAYAKFEQALQMKPGSDLIYAYIKRVGEDVVAGMMNSPDRKIQDLGKRLMELAKPGEPIREGKAQVLKYIEDLQSDEYHIWRNAFWHLKNIAPYSIRFVMPALANKQNDRLRGRVILLLTEIGYDGSLAVVEALDSKDAFVRQQAAIILGNIKDDRAIPALKRVYEDANQPPEVRKFTHEALRKIIRDQGPDQWRRATDYYYELAKKYYYSHSSAILKWQRHYLIWKWDDQNDTLTERKVARMLYNEQLAEEALYDLLKLDPDYVDGEGRTAWSLLACVHLAQANESVAAVEAALHALKFGETIDKAGLVRLIKDIEGKTDEQLASLADAINGAGAFNDVQNVVMKYFDRMAKMIRANVLGELPGKAHLYEALSRSLEDGNYLVSQSCIEILREMGLEADLPGPAPEGEEEREEVSAHGTLGYPLVEALTNEDKRVRYAAARAMVTLNPERRKLGMELVIPSLVDALGEQGVRVALVIYDIGSDEDRNFINGFRKTLLSLGVFPVIATNGEEGVVQAKRFPTEDIIIIQKKICGQIYFQENAVRKPVVETIFDTLRDDVRTRNIPRVILSPSPAEDAEARKMFDQTATAWITNDVDPLDLQKMLQDIFDTPEAKKDAKDRADQMSAEAAKTLASIDITHTLYPYRDAVEALIQTVSPEVLREDFIRIPAATALGNFADQRAVDVLAKVLSDKDSDPEKIARQKGVRWACGKALSRIFKRTGLTPTDDVFTVLMENTTDGDIDIELVCGEALGNARLSNDQRLRLSEHRRIKRETYTSEDP